MTPTCGTGSGGRRTGAARDLHSDSSQSHNAQGFGAQLGALQGFLLPFSRMHGSVRLAERTRHRQHHAQGLLGNCHSVSAGCIHHRNSLTRGRVEVHIIDANSGAPHHAQFGSMLQQLAVDLHRRAYYQGIGISQMLRKIAVNLVGGDDLPSRFPQKVHCIRGNHFCDNNFHKLPGSLGQKNTCAINL